MYRSFLVDHNRRHHTAVNSNSSVAEFRWVFEGRDEMLGASHYADYTMATKLQAGQGWQSRSHPSSIQFKNHTRISGKYQKRAVSTLCKRRQSRCSSFWFDSSTKPSYLMDLLSLKLVGAKARIYVRSWFSSRASTMIRIHSAIPLSCAVIPCIYSNRIVL